MKTSILVSIAILVVGGLLGWRQSVTYEKHLRLNRVLLAKAEALGLPAEAGVDGPEGATKLSERDRQAKEERARAFAKELIAFAKEMKEMEKGGRQPDEEAQKRIFSMINGLLELDGSQLAVLIEELRATSELDDQARREVVGFAIMMMAQDHPEPALALFTESSDLVDMGGMGKHVVSMALARLAGDDPMAAMEWIRKNGEKHPDLVTDDARSAVIGGIAARDPALAISLMDDLKVEAGAARQLAGGARTGEQRDALLAALRQKGDTELTSMTLGALASNLGGQGFEAATEWIGKAELSKEELKGVVLGLQGRQTAEDTGRWIEWIGEQVGQEGNEPIAGLMSRWTRDDYRAAGVWLAGADEGPTKQAAVKSYAETVAPYDPDAAAQWVATLPEGAERSNLARKVYDQWKEKDAEAARRFAGEEGLGLD